MAAERDRQRGGARAAKRELITQTEALIEPFDAAIAEPALARQMEEWKAAGSAGRADDEELWQASARRATRCSRSCGRRVRRAAAKAEHRPAAAIAVPGPARGRAFRSSRRNHP